MNWGVSQRRVVNCTAGTRLCQRVYAPSTVAGNDVVMMAVTRAGEVHSCYASSTGVVDAVNSKTVALLRVALASYVSNTVEVNGVHVRNATRVLMVGHSASVMVADVAVLKWRVSHLRVVEASFVSNMVAETDARNRVGVIRPRQVEATSVSDMEEDVDVDIRRGAPRVYKAARTSARCTEAETDAVLPSVEYSPQAVSVPITADVTDARAVAADVKKPSQVCSTATSTCRAGNKTHRRVL